MRTDFIKYTTTYPSANCELVSSGKLKLISSDYKSFSSPFVEDMLMRTVLFYVETSQINGTTFQSSRLSVSALNSFPLSNVKDMGAIMCMARENAMGGMLHIKSMDFQRELTPGELIILQEPTDSTITGVSVRDPNFEGYLDLVIFKPITATIE
jgi:hypothetical protein